MVNNELIEEGFDLDKAFELFTQGLDEPYKSRCMKYFNELDDFISNHVTDDGYMETDALEEFLTAGFAIVRRIVVNNGPTEGFTIDKLFKKFNQERDKVVNKNTENWDVELCEKVIKYFIPTHDTLAKNRFNP